MYAGSKRKQSCGKGIYAGGIYAGKRKQKGGRRRKGHKKGLPAPLKAWIEAHRRK